MIKWAKSFYKRWTDDDLGAWSGQATLFIVMSSFPFLLLCFNLLHTFRVPVGDIVSVLDLVLPYEFVGQAAPFISEIYESSSSATLIGTLVTTLWAGSRGFSAIISGLNAVYGMKETRGYLKLRGLSLIYTVVFAGLCILTFMLLVFGNDLNQMLITLVNAHFQSVYIDIFFQIFSFRRIFILIVMFVFFWLLYITVPNHEAHPLLELPGAVVTSAGWTIYTFFYYIYYRVMGNLQEVYGSLWAIMLLMLWLYFCMYIMLVGAEVNVQFSEILELRRSLKKARKERARRELEQQTKQLRAQSVETELLRQEARAHAEQTKAESDARHRERAERIQNRQAKLKRRLKGRRIQATDDPDEFPDDVPDASIPETDHDFYPDGPEADDSNVFEVDTADGGPYNSDEYSSEDL